MSKRTAILLLLAGACNAVSASIQIGKDNIAAGVLLGIGGLGFFAAGISKLLEKPRGA